MSHFALSILCSLLFSFLVSQTHCLRLLLVLLISIFFFIFFRFSSSASVSYFIRFFGSGPHTGRCPVVPPHFLFNRSFFLYPSLYPRLLEHEVLQRLFGLFYFHCDPRDEGMGGNRRGSEGNILSFHLLSFSFFLFPSSFIYLHGDILLFALFQWNGQLSTKRSGRKYPLANI